ncbi:hypothetical protein D3C76_692750 [compost metagenome]
MATANTPTQLKNIILQRLGSPVNTINVTEPQLYECIDRALDLYIDYHFDGVNKMYLVRTLTADEAASGLINTGVKLQSVTRVFRNNFGLSSGWTDGSIYDAGWHTAADLLKNMSGSMGGASTGSIFGGGGYGLALYDAFHQYMELLQRFFTPDFQFWFNTDSNSLKILNDGNLREGMVVIVECYVAAGVYVDQSFINQPDADSGLFVTKATQNYHNPYAYTINGTTADPQAGAVFFNQGIYNNRWLKDMATAYTKLQWGTNLKKFSGQPLPGGVQINGQQMYDEANAEIIELRKELMLLSEPLPFYLE